MASTGKLKENILSDMRVELAEMFDRNFERKGFFEDKWKPRKDVKAKGSLLHVTGKMRRSLRGTIKGNGVHFTSPLPYTSLHNEGGTFQQRVRAHTRRSRHTGKTYKVRSHSRTMTMPQRQFIGDHREVQRAIREIVKENVTGFFNDLAKKIKE